MNKTSHGVIFIGISSVIFLLSGYVVNVWLGRYLGPVYYGDYGVIISLMSVINLIQLSGVPQAVSKYISESTEKTDEIMYSGLKLSIFMGFIIGILYFLLAEPISNLLNDISLVPFLRESALIFPLYGVFALYTGYSNGKHLFFKQALMNTAYSISKLLIIFMLAYKFKLFGAVAGFILAPVFGIIPGLYFQKKVKIQFPIKKLIIFSLPLIGFAFFSNLLQSIDLYFIKALIPIKENTGFYTASQNIAKISLFGLSAFSIVLFPCISKSVSEKDIQKTRKFITSGIRYILILILPLALLISSTSTQVIKLIYSNRYLPAAEPLSFLSIGFGLATIFSVLANILNGAGFPKKSLYISILGITLTSILCYFLIPVWGIKGAAISTTIGSLLTVITGGYFIYKQFKVLIPIDSLLRIILSSILIYMLAEIIRPTPRALIIFYPISMCVYFFILFILKEISANDLELLKSFIPNRKSKLGI